MAENRKTLGFFPAKFKCQICYVDFTSMDTLTEHFSSDHAVSKISFWKLAGSSSYCSFDKEEIEQIQDKQSTTETMENNNETNCDYPVEKSQDRKRKTPSRKNQNSYDKEEVEDIQNVKFKPFSCEQCRKSFSKEITLKSHQEIQHKFKCTTCISSFKNESLLKMHIEKNHVEFIFNNDSFLKELIHIVHLNLC